jgi:hypothetical protein
MFNDRPAKADALEGSHGVVPRKAAIQCQHHGSREIL